MGNLFTRSSSIRKWAVGVLRKFDGKVGLFDINSEVTNLFFKCGIELEERSWPQVISGDPPILDLLFRGDRYTPEKQKLLCEAESQKRDVANQLHWELERAFLGDYRMDDKYKIVLVFKKAKVWDILRHVSAIAARDEAEITDIRINYKPFFELKEIKYKISLEFGADGPLLGWWKGERTVRSVKDQSAATIKYIEGIEQGIKTKGKCRVEDIPLTIRFGAENVSFVFTAAGGRMSGLFERSRSVRAGFVDILRRFGGILGGIDRTAGQGILFYLEGYELDEEATIYCWPDDSDRFPQLIKKYRKQCR
jgi:hypothetical protein